LDVQLSESRQQLLENKKAHEQIIRALEANERDAQANKLDNKQLIELRESHRREIKNLETEFESVRKRLTGQIEQLTEKNNELEFKAKFEANDLTKEIANLKEQLEASEIARLKLADQNKNLDSQKLRLLKDSEERYIFKIKQLEGQLEEQTIKSK
jgi:seryl-tRNA synthetase